MRSAFFMEGNNYKEKIIMSVGGSLIVPNGGIDTEFLKKLNSFIRSQLAQYKDRQFFLVIGGGATARHYRDAGRAVLGHEISEEDQDWLGIHATRLNAHLIRTIFRDVAHAHIIEHYDVIRKPVEPIVVASGWKPGWSTDYCAVMLCEDYASRTVINLSNITQIFNKDPKKFPDATPLGKLSWQEYRALVGDIWTPGLNSPFDPVASKRAQQLNVKVVVVNGNDFTNINNYLEGNKFIGTIVE